MAQVQTITVELKDTDTRLDRWFHRYYPDLKNGQLQRLIRAKNIKVNNAKTSTDYRLTAGDMIRIPPMEISEKVDVIRDISKAEIAFMKSLVVYKDNDVIVLNKPSGIAVQGGTKTERHIDGMLDALRFDADSRPNLVHRLDKNTSGVLVLGRNPAATAHLAKSFKNHSAKKVYWAVVVGKPKLLSGKINAPLLKLPNVKGGEQMAIDFEKGQYAQTLYRVIDSLSKKASWIELAPLTGRTHQLRVHCVALNTPIVGDTKYGEQRAVSLGLADDKKMHLHARLIKIPHPNPKKKDLIIEAPLPPHMSIC